MKKRKNIFFSFFLFFTFIFAHLPLVNALPTREQLISNYINLCNANPDIASYKIIGYTVQNNPIYAFTFGKGETTIVIDATIHGWECKSGIALYDVAVWLCSGDAEAEQVINRLKIIIIPILNYDRYGMTRKNANEVDLNRNFVYNWGESGSSDPASEYYRGPYAGSEPETQALRKFLDSVRPKVYVNTHDGGGADPYGDFRRYRLLPSDYVAQYNVFVNRYYEVSALKNVTVWNGTIHTTGYGGYAITDAYQYYKALPILLETHPAEFNYTWISPVIAQRYKCFVIALSDVFGQEAKTTIPLLSREVMLALVSFILAVFCISLLRG